MACTPPQALIAGSGIVGFAYHNSAAALVNGLFCAMLLSLAAYTSFYHYRKCVCDAVPCCTGRVPPSVDVRLCMRIFKSCQSIA